MGQTDRPPRKEEGPECEAEGTPWESSGMCLT